jgi:hypothetical protein
MQNPLRSRSGPRPSQIGVLSIGSMRTVALSVVFALLAALLVVLTPAVSAKAESSTSISASTPTPAPGGTRPSQ